MDEGAGRAKLVAKLGYPFQDIALFEEALRHRSFINEQSDGQLRDNERLEFLGDAVLDLAVGHLLMRRFPDLDEGALSRIRAGLVNEARLASIARKLKLGDCIALGKGELQTRGREKDRILADALEAVLAAVYLDGGYDAAFKLIERHFQPLLNARAHPAGARDYKSRLQELVQARHGEVPVYRVVKEQGPDHEKIFSVELSVCGRLASGSGKSKKSAEQAAARKALALLEGK